MSQNWETLYNDGVSVAFSDKDVDGDCTDNKKILKDIYNLAWFYPKGNFLAVPVVMRVLPITVSFKLKHHTEPSSCTG